MKKHFYSFLAMLTAMFALSSCEDVPMPYDLPIFGGGGSSEGIAPAGTGSLDDPFNVEGVIAFIEAGEGLDEKVYIKGYVTSVKECSPSFGNATFYIASEAGGTNTFYVYRCNGLGGDKITSEDQIKEGDEVVVYGKVTDYNGTKETVQKEAYIYSINGKTGDGGDVDIVTGEPKGDGTQANPYNPVAVIGFINSLADNAKTENDVYIKGVISKVKECSASYGNASFYITETGATNEADFYVYRCLGLGNKPIDSDTYVKEGDEVIICGKVTKYVSQYGATPETVQKEAYIYSLNGKVEGGGTTPDVTPGTPSGNGTIDTPFNVAAAVQKCKETGETATAEQYYVQGIIETINTSGVEQYGNISINMVDVAGSSEVFQAYQINSLNGEKFTLATAGALKKGDVIVIKGNLVNYKGNTPETTGKGAGCLVFVNGKTTIEPGSGDGGGNTGGGTALSSLVNGGFEDWEGTTPTGWKSASTASSATLAQSSDAHGGKYSVSVEGGTANKRLASSEITLAAGTYTFSFYAKATKSDKCQCRPGYVPVTDGKVGSYAYGDYVTIKTGDWTKVSTTFTLDKETVVCLVVMNPKGGTEYMDQQAILIDDATLTK